MIKNIFLSVLELSMSASLAIFVFILFAPFFTKRFPSKWNYWIWKFLSLWLIIPFQKIFLWQDIFEIFTHVATKLQGGNAGSVDHAATINPQIMVAIPPQLMTPIAQQSDQGLQSVTLMDIAAVVWLIGSLVFLGIHLLGYWHYKKKILKCGNLLADDLILHQLQELSQDLQVKRKIAVMQSSDANCPMVIGFFQPVLILPDESYHLNELPFILKHEMIHLKQKDVFVKLFLVICNALHWFNPLVWILCQETMTNMELACDERVVQNADEHVRKAYAEALFASLHRQCVRKSILFTQFYGGKQIMKKRFENILIKAKKKNGYTFFLCAVACIVFLGNLTGCYIKESLMEETSGHIKQISAREGLEKSNKSSVGELGQTNMSFSEESSEQGKETLSDQTSGLEDGTNSNIQKEQKETNLKKSILTYIKEFDTDSRSISFDEVEWVSVPSERAAELGIEDELHLASGFYVYNEEDDVANLPMAKSCNCTILNWYSSYEAMEVSVDKLFDVLEERKDVSGNIPYILTIQNHEIVSIEEHYVP